MAGTAAGTKNDLIDTLHADASFKTLICALQTAHMVDLWKGSGPFTLFAPTDEAFAKLPGGQISKLEMPENFAKLTDLLERHITKGAYSASDLRQRESIEAKNGVRHHIASDSSGLRIDGAVVLGREISCTNGIIHVLDSVL
jgi:transforming growth factor-beta-induced protein